jgi:hypothetical protein
VIRHIKLSALGKRMFSLPKQQQTHIHLDSLKWIIGNWYSGNDIEKMEEHWHPKMGNALAGWFRWEKNQSIFLYEFMLFQQNDNGVKLKIKHFNTDLVGWEDKDKWVEYIAWESTANKIMLKAADPNHTPWMCYEKVDNALGVNFYDATGKKTDEFTFHT